MLQLARAIVRPVGYLLFVIALLALSAVAKLLGDKDELGFFSGRLAAMLWRYPEVTRPGVQIAWLTWAGLVAVAVSPLDPIASRWDEIGLGMAALLVVWRRVFGGRRAGH